MNLTELNKDLKDICKCFKIGKLESFETKKNDPITGFNTAYFTVKNDKKVYKYHFKK